jgi:ABC-type nitrate/sulfonate/bicarbonate transport system substrate-binding protein
MLAGGVNTLFFSIVAGPGIERLEALRGKRLGITRLGTSSDFAGRLALRQAGIQPDTDVQFIQMSDAPAVLQRMVADAAILEDTWQSYANTYFERVPYATVAGLQFDVDQLAVTVPAAAGVRAETYVDNRSMDELVRGGLIERLYGR